MIKYIISFVVFIVGFFSLSFGGSWDQEPNEIVEDLHTNVQKTAIDSKVSGSGKGIKETLQDVKSGTGGYIQWLGYIGLAAAFLLIIYNGLIVLANFGSEDKFSKAKKRFLSLILGVIVITSGYIIIKFVLGLVGGVFN